MAKEDLIPLNKRTKEEQKEITRKGGIKSGEVRREKAQLKSAIKVVLSLPVKSPKVKKMLEDMGIPEADIDNAVLPAIGLFKKACKGDPAAVRLLAELNGENQVQGTTNIDSEGVKFNISFTGKGGNDADT
jgi:hypothetical protein